MLVDYSSDRVLFIYLLRTQSRTMTGVLDDFSRLCALMREGRADQIEELYRDRSSNGRPITTDRIKAIKHYANKIMTFKKMLYLKC